MINPINLAFKNAKEKKRPALLSYTVAGDNTKKKSLEILKSISKDVDISSYFSYIFCVFIGILVFLIFVRRRGGFYWASPGNPADPGSGTGAGRTRFTTSRRTSTSFLGRG